MQRIFLEFDKKLKFLYYSIVIKKNEKGEFQVNNTIEIKNLNKFYGKKQALYDVNLSIQPGMFGLLGRNGA